MRVTLSDATLTRQAGRFVWLELDYDKPANQAFLARRGAAWTPSFYVLDPADERATATQLGGMTLAELNRFLDQGERGVRRKAESPADAALTRGDAMLGRGRLGDAAKAYGDALRLAGPAWPERNEAVGSLARALLAGGESRACAETAAAEAPGMPRERAFASVVLSGLSCANQGGAAPWAEAARKRLLPLAEEAAALEAALRDDRFELYQQLMHEAQHRGDNVTVARWGHLWLDEIEATTPASDEERSALDIARVDAASFVNEPARVLPALTASEKKMPGNYNASLRLAQMATEAKRYDDALAACERGLAHVTGPVARTWILRTKADALTGKGDTAGARRALEQALRYARTIGNKHNRDHNVMMITMAKEELSKPASP